MQQSTVKLTNTFRDLDAEMNELWDYLTDTMLVTDEEVSLVTSINGTSLDTFESILYVRTGYRSLEQILEAEAE